MSENIDWSNLSFGYMKTDYNVRCYFRNGAWGEIELSSEESINMHMAATCLHYGQEAFEGLDGLAGGLSAIAFLAFGLISWGSFWIEGYQDIGIFCFVLVGSIMGFLVYNSHPAKVFMGDTGSLTLGATLATVAILTSHELSLAVWIVK